MTADLDALFKKYAGRIHGMAKRLRAQFPSVALDDLQQAGAQGLVKGMSVYEARDDIRDPDQHQRAFLQKWIEGAMKMHVRKDAAVHRYEREAGDALREGLGRHANDDGSVSAAAEVFSIMDSLALDAYTRRTPEDEMLQQETLSAIDMFYAELTDQEREFVRLRYLEELTLEEIGVAFGYAPASAKSSMSRMEKRIQTQARLFTDR